MIRRQAGMPTSRFTTLVGIPQRTYRRWQARARDGRPARGPWPTPTQDQFEEVVVQLADRWPGWGHRKIAQIARTDGHPVSDSTALRALKRNGRVFAPGYTVNAETMPLPAGWRSSRRHPDATKWDLRIGLGSSNSAAVAMGVAEATVPMLRGVAARSAG